MAFKKNDNIKVAGQQSELTLEQVAEFLKCGNDPMYFINNYCKVVHPKLGPMPFTLRPYQKAMIDAYWKNRYSIVLSARQTGKSVGAAAYILWYAIFQRHKTVLIASNKNKNAMEMIHRIKYMYENVPMWLKPGVMDDGWNKHSLSFDNGSRIMSEATSENSGRGGDISLLYLDEFAFVPPHIQSEFWASIEPTLSTGGELIMTSTPNGDQNIYAQLWRGANIPAAHGSKLGSNGFFPVRVEWDEAPNRDGRFKEETIARIGERKWMQEYECEFVSSDGLLIDSLFLVNLTAELKNVKEAFRFKDVVFWDKPKRGGTYLVGVDPATGTGKDYSVLSVYEFPSLEQVAEYRTNSMSTSKVYVVLKNILKYLESADATIYFSVENNGVGEGIIALFEADENPPDASEFVSEEGRLVRGMNTTGKKKMAACVNFKEMLEKGTIKIRSTILLEELKSFVSTRGAYAAQAGSTDDCISASLIMVRLLEEISSYDQHAFDKLYTIEDETWTNDDFDGYGDYDENDIPLPMSF